MQGHSHDKQTGGGFGRRTRKIIFTAIACVGLVGMGTMAACAQAPEKKVVQQDDHRRHNPALTVVDATYQHAGLSVDQEIALADIEAQIVANDAVKDAVKERLRVSASNAVRNGSVDSAEFEEAVEVAVETMETKMNQTRDAVVAIHELLDPDQREEVAEALHAHIDARFDGRTGKQKRKVKSLIRRLALSEGQEAALKDLRDKARSDHHDLRPTREQLHALVDAFTTDDFAATVDAFHADKLVAMRRHLAHAGQDVDTALSILTDDQRDVLADIIEKGPQAFGVPEAEQQTEQVAQQ